LSSLVPDNYHAAADEPEPSWTGKVKVDAALVADEPERSLEGRAKAAAANEPEPSLTGKVKAVDEVEAQEPEKAHAEESETAILNSLADEPRPEVEQDEAKAGASLVAEPELPLEGRDEVDLGVADEPEASLERMATEDATAAEEPEPKASSEEEAIVNVAHTTTPAESETETSHEEEVMTNAEPLAEPIPEVEQGEVTAEPALADEPETADAIMLTQEPEKVEQMLADEPETADAFMLAQEPEKAESSLANESFNSLFDEKDNAKDEMDTSDNQEVNDQMIVDEGEPSGEQQVDDEMAEIGDLAAIQQQEQIRAAAETRVNFLTQLQRMAEQSRAADQEPAAARAAQQEEARVEARRRELAEQQAGREEEDWLAHADLLARIQAEGEPALTAGQASAEPASVGVAGAVDTAFAATLEAAVERFKGEDDEDTSFNGDDLERLEDIEYLHQEHDFSLGLVEEDEEEEEEGDEFDTATEGVPEAEPQSASTEEAEPTESAEETRVGRMPTATPATAAPILNFGGAAYQTIPEAVPPVFQFVIRADTPATAVPTQRPAQAAADAETALAQEAGPPQADPEVLARRKRLPRGGVRGSKEAKLRILQEFRETQPAPNEEEVKEEAVKGAVEEVEEEDEFEGDSFLRQVAEYDPDIWDDIKAEKARAKAKAASKGKDAA
jgi:hypothetical protein